jgi:hypothetical protein
MTASPLRLEPRAFPARLADLGFTVPLPPDWIAHELPAEAPDFTEAKTLAPLAVVTAPHAAIILALAARPAAPLGSLGDWTSYLLEQHGLAPRGLKEGRLGPLPALLGEALQPSELGPMVVRFAFCEDGGRLLNLSFSAPEMLADAVLPVWRAIEKQFVLTCPQGPTLPLQPGGEVGVPPSEPAAEPAAPAPKPAAPPAAVPAKPAEPAPTFADFALATDAGTLDPAHPINANLRERGAGLTPNVAAVDLAARHATVAAGALAAFLDVPLGWHVLDDGGRTLVFEPSNAVQISLDLLPRDDRDNDTILDAFEADLRDAHARVECLRLARGGLWGLAARGLRDGDQPLEQVFLLRPGRDDRMLLRARVTAAPARITGAVNLAELILHGARRGATPDAEPPAAEAEPPEAAAPPTARPAWYREAQALERAGELKRMEELVRDAVPHASFAVVLAELYRERMERLRTAGDPAGAKAARAQAADWIGFYASMATSGGEGAAFSQERDEFLAALPEL